MEVINKFIGESLVARGQLLGKFPIANPIS
jgi:hypothetical protein